MDCLMNWFVATSPAVTHALLLPSLSLILIRLLLPLPLLPTITMTTSITIANPRTKASVTRMAHPAGQLIDQSLIRKALLLAAVNTENSSNSPTHYAVGTTAAPATRSLAATDAVSVCLPACYI